MRSFASLRSRMLARTMRRIRNVIKTIRERWATRSVGAREKLWDKEYGSGFAEQLRLPEALEHNHTLVEFLVSAKKNKRILDVGCGEGLILEALEKWGYESYVGMDFSEVALRIASKQANAKTVFVHAVAESFVPDGEFDAIIFNECLYYLREPLRVVRHYEKFLSAGGVMAVSLFTKTERVKRLGEEIEKEFRVTRRATVRNGTGTWECYLVER